VIPSNLVRWSLGLNARLGGGLLEPAWEDPPRDPNHVAVLADFDPEL
jgi:hypothetical protein